MQFHLNGFRSGDPRDRQIFENDTHFRELTDDECFDVVIVGSGPAGLALGAVLSQYKGLKIAMLEKKSGRLSIGQADGIACRTMETFEALGIAAGILEESYWVNETAFWVLDDLEDGGRGIRRDKVILDTEKGLSEFPHVILNQARVHDYLLKKINQSPSKFNLYYSMEFQNFDISINDREFPISISCIDGRSDMRPISIRSKFLVGCDGARSRVRSAMDLEMIGDKTDKIWGVLDVLAVTNFPDIRKKTIIQSQSEGTLLVIPREGGYMVRLYVELDSGLAKVFGAKNRITPDFIIGVANKIIKPYRIEAREVAWWSAYEIGQRITKCFDNRYCVDGAPQVFIAGDACHTHSPKAGQGMNVSIQDGFNLGWKLGAVIAGISSRNLLKTYSDERHSIATSLINFDKTFSRIFASAQGNPKDHSKNDLEEFQSYFVKHGRYTAGVETVYSESLTIAVESNPNLATGFPLGKRFHSYPVTRICDAKLIELGHILKFDTRWRLMVFCPRGELKKIHESIIEFCDWMTESRESLLNTFNREGSDCDEIFDIRFILQGEPSEYVDLRLPFLMRPEKGSYSLIDYEKIFCSGGPDIDDIFVAREINKEDGCIVIVRPDQHVAGVLPIDQYKRMTDFFKKFMNVSAEKDVEVNDV